MAAGQRQRQAEGVIPESDSILFEPAGGSVLQCSCICRSATDLSTSTLGTRLRSPAFELRCFPRLSLGESPYGMTAVRFGDGSS